MAARAGAARGPRDTVGSLLARDNAGIAHDDWHRFAPDRSRYMLLELTASAIDLDFGPC